MMKQQRREFLAASGAVFVGAIAGCSGNSVSAPIEEQDYMVDELPAPSVGADGTPIEVYIDYMCPACANWHADVFPELVEQDVQSDEARIIHRDFPLPISDKSWKAASAARAVQNVDGVVSFWDFTASVLQEQDQIDEDWIRSIASEFSIEGDRLVEAYNNYVYLPVVQNSRQRGENAGISSTPGIVIDGQKIEEDQKRFDIEFIRSRL